MRAYVLAYTCLTYVIILRTNLFSFLTIRVVIYLYSLISVCLTNEIITGVITAVIISRVHL